MTEPKTFPVNIEPTARAYEEIALQFMQNVLGDVPTKRREDAASLLRQAVRIAMYLAVKHAPEAQALLNATEGWGEDRGQA